MSRPLLVVGMSAALAGGCQVGNFFSLATSTSTSTGPVFAERSLLPASDWGPEAVPQPASDPPPPVTKPADEKEEPDKEKPEPEDAKEETDKPTTPRVEPPYTQPRSSYRLLTFYLSAALGTLEDEGFRNSNTGVEGAENLALPSTIAFGLPEFQPSIDVNTGRTLGIPGLLSGGSLGGGSSFVNIFQPTTNPLAGPCGELFRAGFFADVDACRNHFRR